ncbi:AbrB family transcriptional regulator [Mangrovicoccus ximenensis]|uniref:AbrB family transcriptional regulator n=1 Tax=Mangrovicoccus ximenensis TaxID=1911570 RepID=UPI0013750284|nr:AbrB family transcriptional regulator [Mangrovicoccus ximenensis]
MPTVPAPLKLALVYLAASLGGLVFHLAGLPLPWMIGPLVATALLLFNDRIDVRIPVKTRPFGQGIVASQVGLAFSPAVFASLLEMAPMLVGMAFLLIVIAFAIAVLLSRMGRISLSSAMVATLPTSPVEAAVIGERYGFPAAPIVLSQTMRIATVVVLVPMAIVALDGHHGLSGNRFVGSFDPLGTGALMALSLAGMAAFRKLGLSNPYFLGPLAVSSAVTAAGLDLPDYPSVILWAAQVVLGTWLGSNFRRSLFRSAGRLMTASVISTLLFISASAVISATLAPLLGLSWQTLVLASTPGGVTEMALTAKFLGVDVALITAFHLVRIFIVMPLVPVLIDRVHRFERP